MVYLETWWFIWFYYGLIWIYYMFNNVGIPRPQTTHDWEWWTYQLSMVMTGGWFIIVILALYSLVGRLEHVFPLYWECHHPNWQTYIVQRGRYTIHIVQRGKLNQQKTNSCLWHVVNPKWVVSWSTCTGTLATRFHGISRATASNVNHENVEVDLFRWTPVWECLACLVKGKDAGT